MTFRCEERLLAFHDILKDSKLTRAAESPWHVTKSSHAHWMLLQCLHCQIQILGDQISEQAGSLAMFAHSSGC